MPPIQSTARPAGLLVSVMLASTLLAAGCVQHREGPPSSAAAWADTRQLVLVLVLVTVPDWDTDHGTLRRYDRGVSGWRQVGSARPVMSGRSGAAWGAGLHPSPQQGPVKREGEGRAPAGVFRIGRAFGYAAEAATALPYDAMQASHYCVDVNESPLYNRIVDTRAVGAQAVALAPPFMDLALALPAACHPGSPLSSPGPTASTDSATGGRRHAAA